MKINVRRIDQNFHMEAVNDTGNTVQMDGSPQIGGNNKGVRPMQMLLMGVAGCSMIDIISILRKQRIELDSIEAEVEGFRNPDEVPSLFKEIHLVFKVGGTSETDKVERAVKLSMDKYCSVAKALEKTANITYEINYL